MGNSELGTISRDIKNVARILAARLKGTGGNIDAFQPGSVDPFNTRDYEYFENRRGPA